MDDSRIPINTSGLADLCPKCGASGLDITCFSDTRAPRYICSENPEHGVWYGDSSYLEMSDEI